jgi:predicted ABC-type ATPase
MKPPPPQIYLIGGPNGAGKTTFARHFLPAVGIREFLNADSIAAGLSPLDPPAAAIRAARLLLTRWRELVQKGLNFGFESTLSGLTYAAMLRDAKSQGYQINLCYLHLTTVQHSIRRVRERVKKGGHNVPLADLKRRFLPSLRNFFQVYQPLADQAALYDSTLHPPLLVAEWQPGSSIIHQPAAHEAILAKIR